MNELDTKTDARQVWRTIRSLDGRSAPRKENEVLLIDGKAYVGDRKKAHEFEKVYKKVSRSVEQRMISPSKRRTDTSSEGDKDLRASLRQRSHGKS